MSNQSQKNRPPARGGTGGGGANRGGGGSGGNRGAGPKPPPRRQPAYYAPQRRDPFPYILGGLLALLVVGVFAVVFLLSSKNNPPTVAAVPTTVPAATADPSQPTVAAPNTTGVPRMPLADFKAIYDDPAQKANMLIIDVRAKESFDAGHIKDAQSWPESEIDASVVKLPKDKLIVAYCQWPAENESSRVALKLHDTYGFSYDNLKVLLGGWTSWQQESAKDSKAYPVGP